MAPLSKEEENYIRLTLLLKGVSPRAVRTFFDTKFPPTYLPSTLNKNYNTLYDLNSKKVLNQAQWNLLFPSSNVPDSKTFDVTLMICLIRNLTPIISPSNGFDKLPLPGETTPGSDLARIKWYRNILAHHGSNTMANTEFNTAWTTISNAVSRLGDSSFIQECIELKEKILDQSNQEIMLEIKHSQEEMKELRRKMDIEHTTIKESLGDMQISHITLQTEHSKATKDLEEVKEMLKDPKPWNMIEIPGNIFILANPLYIDDLLLQFSLLKHVKMKKKLQLFVSGLEGKTTSIRIDEGASITQLMRVIHEKTLINLEEMRVLYCSKELRDTDGIGKEQILTDYRIQDEGMLLLVLRLRGEYDQQEQINGTVDIVFSDTVDATEDLSPPPKVYGSNVELTLEPDMITLNDDKDKQRAKMPCGHAIGPESLTVYCRSLLTSGKCPHMDPSYCGRIWEFYTVNKLAVLTKEEKKEFEKQIAINFLRKAVGIQECPRCQSYCERMDRKEVRVVCPVCSRKPDGRFEFCWFCLRKWSTSGTAECGNLYCSGEDPRKKILEECPEKKVTEVSCPSVRACPECRLMIEHKEACKQMECPCGQKFCFICLKMADERGQYTCGAWNFKCVKAPVQTQLP